MVSKVEKFLEDNGMNYTVSKQPAVVRNGDGTYSDVEGQYHLVRSTDGAVISPSTVTDRYAPTNPQQMVEPLNPLVAEGWITPDKCFLFKNDSYEVIAFRIDGGQLENGGNIMDENWNHYVSVHNHQGGGGSLKASMHSHRIICGNTAVRAAKMATIKIRHTGSIQKNYDLAMQTWKQLNEEIREISKRMEVFADTKVSAKDAEEILRDIYGVKGKTAEEISTRTANELEFAIQEFSNPRRGTFGRSLADVYNAITSTNSHYAPKSSKEDGNRRMASLLDENGSRNKLELVTMSTLLELAGIDD